MAGLFITFEGIDGAGKTTQAKMLTKHLQRAAQPVVKTQEPGGTFFGVFIRELIKRDVLLKRASQAITGRREKVVVDTTAELLLFEAARAQLVSEVIRPCLETGGVVVCDRYTDSTIAYQGYGRGLNLSIIEKANALATGGLAPDVTFLLDIPVEMGVARKAESRNAEKQGPAKDRFDEEELIFHQNVKKGYLKLAASEPERWTVIDGTLSAEEIADKVWEVVKGKLEPVDIGDAANQDEVIFVRE